MENNFLYSKISKMPKVILHLHLDGSLNIDTVYEWMKKKNSNINLSDLQNKMQVEKNCSNLNEYLKKFTLPMDFLQSTKNIEKASYELFKKLSNQNVIYAEIRFAPSLHIKEGLSYSQVIESAINGMEQAKKEYNIDGNLILCCMRGKDNIEKNINTLKYAKEYLNNGVCGLDLAGAEALYPTEDYEYIFKEAKKMNIPFTIHAGEAAGANSIKKAIEFGAKRIGHGIRCLEIDEVVNELIEKEIPLEICPTSNFQTKAIKGKYPLEEIYKKGIKVTINSDNDTVSNTNILEEYKYVLQNTSLNIHDLKQMNINAVYGAFINEQKKEKLKKIIEEFE